MLAASPPLARLRLPNRWSTGQCRSDSGASSVRAWSSSIFAMKAKEYRPSSWSPMSIGSAKTPRYSRGSSPGAATEYQSQPWWPTSPTHSTQVGRRPSLGSAERHARDRIEPNREHTLPAAWAIPGVATVAAVMTTLTAFSPANVEAAGVLGDDNRCAAEVMSSGVACGASTRQWGRVPVPRGRQPVKVRSRSPMTNLRAGLYPRSRHRTERRTGAWQTQRPKVSRHRK